MPHLNLTNVIRDALKEAPSIRERYADLKETDENVEHLLIEAIAMEENLRAIRKRLDDEERISTLCQGSRHFLPTLARACQCGALRARR